MDKIRFSEKAINGNVDSETGTIANVSLISNVFGEAKGHGVKIDEKSIQSFSDAVTDKKIRAFYTHDIDNECLDSLGWFENFRIEREGELVSLRGDFVSLDSFRQHQPEMFDKLFELASETPELVHVSAEFLADYVTYSDEGEEQQVSDFSQDEDIFVRCRECHAFSFVAHGATNESLFSYETNGKLEFGYEEILEATCDKQAEEIVELRHQLETLKELAIETKEQKDSFENQFLELKEQLEEYKSSGEETLEPNYHSENTILDELEGIKNPLQRSKFVLENANELWKFNGAVDK